ncbi:MAG: sigma-E processing peptidase SpoIIGA [Bacilli bacterium]|nr:sigma-E processing peptidase SpoIIGA [Bacilli bacterium]
MVVYLDLVIISTVLVNTLIILGICSFLNEHYNILRIILSDILSVLLLSLYILPIGKLIFIRYLCGIIIGFVAFNKCSLPKMIIKLVLYYLFNLTLVGILEVFNIKNMFLLIISSILIIMMFIIISFTNHHELSVKLENKYLNALYDSGNLSSYHNIPIVYLKQNYFNKSYIYLDKISIETINGINQVDIYQGPNLKINHKEYKVYYAFCSLTDFDIILNKEIGGMRCLS